ncbi:MAG: SDR family NAD(P)-dependent oxidoreductase [Bacilli bacterium]
MNILITGAKRGIGHHTAIELAKRNHLVYVTTHYKEDALSLNRKFRNKENLIAFKLDITKKEDRNKIKNLEIDVLINNAAIGESGSISEIPIDLVRDTFNTNVFSTFELIQLVLSDMIKKDKGKIISIGSTVGTMPKTWMGVYSATKASIETLLITLRRELQYINSNVKVILIEAGAFHTGFNQDMIKSKNKWFDNNSYFYNIKKELYEEEDKFFKKIEKKELDTIVNKIVSAVESDNPKFRYTVPISHYLVSKLYKIFINK